MDFQKQYSSKRANYNYERTKTISSPERANFCFSSVVFSWKCGQCYKSLPFTTSRMWFAPAVTRWLWARRQLAHQVTMKVLELQAPRRAPRVIKKTSCLFFWDLQTEFYELAPIYLQPVAARKFIDESDPPGRSGMSCRRCVATWKGTAAENPAQGKRRKPKKTMPFRVFLHTGSHTHPAYLSAYLICLLGRTE